MSGLMCTEKYINIIRCATVFRGVYGLAISEDSSVSQEKDALHVQHTRTHIHTHTHTHKRTHSCTTNLYALPQACVCMCVLEANNCGKTTQETAFK